MMLRAFAAFLSLSIAGTAAADTIHLVDGKTIASVEVVSEGLKQVTYKEGRDSKTLPSETVRSIDYDERPEPLSEVEGFLLVEDLESAVDTLDAYVQAVADKPSLASKFKWAPAHAAWRSIEVRQSALDFNGIKTAATKLIQNFPDTRFVPLAYLAKARAELSAGQGAQAEKTLGDFSGLISSEGLPKRWDLECRLLKTQVDSSSKPGARRDAYEAVVGEAAGLPSVQAWARVLIGDSYVAESATKKDLLAKAKAEFEKVIGSEGAGREAVAAAHAGLGEVLFLQGADVDDKALLEQSALEFLRVATLYRDQGPIVAKSLFYSMRCFDLMQDPRRKFEMKRELTGLFPTSSWAEEAKKF